MPELLRLAAFTTEPTGGNPAGVWIGEAHPDDATMQTIAAEVGYSETAFFAPDPARGARSADADPHALVVRYFSPVAEVAFCGHATVAGGVALAERFGPGRFDLATANGPVSLDVGTGADGRFRATLTSVEPRIVPAGAALIDEALEALGWTPELLDPSIPPVMTFAGVWHLVLAVASYDTLASMTYDFDRMLAAMRTVDMTTAQLVWRESAVLYRARDPFAVGGVVEDPATGAAAAAFGAYLRHLGAIRPPATFTILQGVEMGRPSRIEVTVPAATGGILVSGTAVPIERPAD